MSEFKAENALGDKLTELTRQELCELAGKICAYIREESGAGEYHGGIYPGGISVDENGEVAVVMPHTQSWTEDELLFIAPELYWHGQGSPAADVYSLGMLLYYAASKGRVPFESKSYDAKKANTRRMGGDKIKAPAAAGRRLSEIIEKATQFKAADRYQSMEEMQAVIDSCIKNLYLSGVPCAEMIFNKNDDDLSDIEKMMVAIIESGEPEPTVTDESDDAEEAQPNVIPDEPDVKIVSDLTGTKREEPKPGKIRFEAADLAQFTDGEKPQETEPTEPADERAVQAPEESIPAKPPVVELREEVNPVLEPVVPKPPVKQPAVQYSKRVARERQIAEEVKKRRRRPVIVLLALCALLVVIAFIYDVISRDPSERAESEPTASVDIVLPSAEPVETEPVDTPQTVIQHNYELIIADVSWEQAAARAKELGGYLVTINDEEEFRKVVNLAEDKGDIYGDLYVWIGCHRVDGNIVWESGETVDYYRWGENEPSYYDAWDNAEENYVFIWNHDGWVYNDSRNDPIGEGYYNYVGKTAFVVEYEKEVPVQ